MSYRTSTPWAAAEGADVYRITAVRYDWWADRPEGAADDVPLGVACVRLVPAAYHPDAVTDPRDEEGRHPTLYLPFYSNAGPECGANVAIRMPAEAAR